MLTAASWTLVAAVAAATPDMFSTGDLRIGYYVWPVVLTLLFFAGAAAFGYFGYRSGRSYYSRNTTIGHLAGGVACLGLSGFFANRAYNRIEEGAAVVGGFSTVAVLVVIFVIWAVVSNGSSR